VSSMRRFDALFTGVRGKWNSQKFICTIVHTTPSQRRENAFRGQPRRVGADYMLWWCMKIRGRE
jgi:hypothetical protein